MTKPKDPLLRDIKQNYAQSSIKKVDDLMLLQSRWQRKLTIAQNKLDHCRRQIDTALKTMAVDKDKLEAELKEKGRTP